MEASEVRRQRRQPDSEYTVRPDLTSARVILAAGVILPFVATIIAIVLLWNELVTWRDLAIFAFMYTACGLGVTVGFHRMLTHRSFEAHPVVRFLLLAFGTMSVETGPVAWAAMHLKHHAHSDEPGDPHSPLDGFIHSHFGWMFQGRVINAADHGPWLLRDPMVMFFERTFAFWVVLGFVVPFLLGGWTGMLWGGFVRVFFTHHVTWSVNSVCHTFGNRAFATKDRSRNCWPVGLLAFGEGWHNNHHAFPNSAEHGLTRWQFDFSAMVIAALERVGLAWNVRRVSPELMARKALVQEP
jgi:stearoyl-CoA desaturase (delta-9 desaturase)